MYLLGKHANFLGKKTVLKLTSVPSYHLDNYPLLFAGPKANFVILRNYAEKDSELCAFGIGEAHHRKRGKTWSCGAQYHTGRRVRETGTVPPSISSAAF